MSLQDKIYGCFLGSAIGNAMGSPAENWTYEKIERTYGKIEMPLLLDRIKTEDDFQIALLLTRAYLKYKRNITPEDLAQVWLEKFDPGDNFFWCMRNALELLRRGVSPRQTGMYNINTGSALMAIAPVGLFNVGEPDRAFSDALDLAYMYQPKPDAYCAAAMAAGFSEALKPNAKVDDVVNAILEHCLEKDIEHWDKTRELKNIKQSVSTGVKIAEEYGNDWWAARSAIYNRLTQWHPIDPIEVLSISTCLFMMSGGKYLEGVIAGTNIGRDSDTIANLVGGLCCCLKGSKPIPEDWIEGVKEINPSLLETFEVLSSKFAFLLKQKMSNYADLAANFSALY